MQLVHHVHDGRTRLVENLGSMRRQDSRKGSQQDALCERKKCHERFFLGRESFIHLILAVANVDQKEREKELTHGHDGPHEETNGHAVVELSHDHGSPNTQDTQHHGGPKGGKAFGKGSRAHDAKTANHESCRHAQNRVPAETGVSVCVWA